MKKFFIVFLSAVFVLTSNSYAAEISVEGKITSLNKGVQGVEVSVGDQIYETDAEGRYKAEKIQSDTEYTIEVERPDFYPSPTRITTSTKNINNADFVVSGEITGQVVYKGIPLKNSIVKINDRNQEYITDIEGKYKILNVGLNQEYTVTVSSKNYSFKPKKIILRTFKPATPKTVEKSTAAATTDDSQKYDIEDKTNVLNFEADILRYSITVTAVQGLTPLENVEITVNNNAENKYKTNKEGICKIENLVCGRKYFVKAEKKGVNFVKRIQTINVLNHDENINFETYLNVSGKVTIDNEPFPNVIIECGDKKVKTDKNGQYEFDNIEPNKLYEIKTVSSVFGFAPINIPIKSLKMSLTENNFVAKVESVTEENKKTLLKERKVKLAAQKKEADKIEKEEKIKQKDLAVKMKKSQEEEDFKVKEELLKEEERIKKEQLKIEKEVAEYKAKCEAAEAKKEASSAADTVKKEISQKKNIQEINKEVAAENAAEKIAESKIEQQEQETVFIQGRVMKNKDGVGGVQIMLIMPPETKKYSTDKNGFYKISGLAKNKNYVLTVLSDSKIADLSPKSRIYKDLKTNMINQNFYYVTGNKQTKSGNKK